MATKGINEASVEVVDLRVINTLSSRLAFGIQYLAKRSHVRTRRLQHRLETLDKELYAIATGIVNLHKLTHQPVAAQLDVDRKPSVQLKSSGHVLSVDV